MRFGLCNEMCENWNWEKVCDLAAKLGYHGVEIAPFTLGAADKIPAARRAEIRRQAESRGLEIVGLHWLLVKTEGLHMTHPDAAVRRKTADYFKALVGLCADLGGKVLVIGSPGQRNLQEGVSREQAIANAIEVFTPALEPAQKAGITLALEPLSPKETNFITSAAEGVEVIEQINHPNFRLHLDVKAMSPESKPIPQVIRDSAKHIAHFHANDPNLLGPGMGEVKYEPIVAALREVGYDGWLSVEVFDFKPGAETIARESIEYLKKVTS